MTLIRVLNAVALGFARGIIAAAALPWAVCVALLAAAVLSACSALSAVSGEQYGTQCGVELWDKKTLRDKDARKVSYTMHDTTIAWLDSQRAPADPDVITRRISPVETTVWRVRAELVGYRIEADGDYHLVLRDPQSQTPMIGEVPAPYCVTSLADHYRALRATIDRIGGRKASSRWWWLDYHGETPPTVVIFGIGFFDRIHESNGKAPNGVELHPVLGISP
jgi:hypothetical protein